MTKWTTLLVIVLSVSWHLQTPQRDPGAGGRIKALVGGTLIDGFGGVPIRNSVILIDGERITRVGTVGALAVPAGAEVISTEGMSVLPGLWWDPLESTCRHASLSIL